MVVFKKMNEWTERHEEAWHGYLYLDESRLSKIQLLSRDKLVSTGLIKSETIINENDFLEKVIVLKIANSPGLIKIYNGDAEFSNIAEFFHVEENGCLTPVDFIDQLVGKLNELKSA